MTPIHYHAGGFPPPRDAIDWHAVLPHLGPATSAVARYDSLLHAIPNSRVLLSPLSTQEAVLSSRIEGTRATMNEVLEFEAHGHAQSPELSADIHEILNYRRAMIEAERMLETLPVSLRVIRRAHAVLLDGVRGAGKAPGEFRRVPNWIGPPGCAIEEARFVPPPAQDLPDALGRWERYANADATEVPDRMVQLAIVHAEFEALHPFLDGNGRLGRMLIPLLLWQWKVIEQPHFYISGYLEAHRDDYYEALLTVSRDRDWTVWVRFFLKAVRTQAEENLGKARAIVGLHDDLRRRMPDMTRSRYSMAAMDWIFGRPIFSAPMLFRQARIPERTARRLVAVLRDNGVIRNLAPASGRRSRLLVFPDLLNIAEGRSTF